MAVGDVADLDCGFGSQEMKSCHRAVALALSNYKIRNSIWKKNIIIWKISVEIWKINAYIWKIHLIGKIYAEL